MIHLRDFSRTEPFLAFMRRITEAVLEAGKVSYLQGFVLTYDPMWSAFGRWLHSGGNADGFPMRYSPPPLAPQALDAPHQAMMDLVPAQYFTDDYEDTRVWKLWQRYVGAGSSRKPFFAKVCLAPTTPDTRTLRTVLEGICAAETNFSAICEDRERARLLSLEGGRSMTAGTNPGTVGGFLKDQGGTVRGVTCGHVGQSVSQSVSMQDMANASRTVGQVSHTNWALSATPAGTLCNNQGSGPANDVDIALIDLGSGETPTQTVRGVGDVTDIFGLAQLGSGHNVRMSGAVSGANGYYITGYVVIYNIPYHGNHYCFKDLFEIAGISRPRYFGVFGAFTPVPQAGDSGGWICCPDPNGDHALWGMLLAGDNNRGYACFTDQMQAWAKGRSLTLGVL
jgi:hypothetical protein